MRELAMGILSSLDSLADEYSRRLRAVPGYAEMLDVDRLEMARNAWLLIAAGLEAGEPGLYTEFVHAVVRKRVTQGLDLESVQQALNVLVGILESRVPSAEAKHLLWRTMGRVHLQFAEMAIAQMRTAEEQFRYLADNLAVGIFIHREGILRYAGYEGTRMLGYDHPEELINRSVFDFVHPSDRARVADIAQRRVTGQPVPDQYEARLLKKDGSSIDAQLYSALTRYEGHVATQGIFIDISERKREETRIRQAQRSMQLLIDSMPFGVMIVGQDKRIRHANQSALASMGYESVDQVLGRICQETMCPAEADRCPILDLGQRLDRSERVLLTNQGQAVPILKSAVPLTLGKEKVLLEAFIDITEQREAQAEIERLARALEAAHDAIAITDVKGLVLFVNPAFEQLTGYSLKEVRGRNIGILRSGLRPDEFYADMWQTALAGRVWQGEVVYQRKEGTLYEAQLSISPVRNASGEVEQFIAAQRDITQQKQLERQIQESLERRGRQVQTSTEIAQEIATAPALDELYQKVVTLVKERFGYYHAQLFLLNEEKDRLVAVAGYGDLGRKLAEQGHSRPMGRGVVGRAAASRRPVLSPDVNQDPEWLYHPLLHETRGEMAVPIVLRQTIPEDGSAEGDGEVYGRVLGVLDVQSDKPNVLTDDDRLLLEGLGGQIAIAIESTRLRQETEAHLQELERLTRALSREGWEAFRRQAGAIGYLFEQQDIVPADSFWTPEMGEAAEQGVFTPPAPESQSMAVAPLKVRGGEFIGLLGVQNDPENPLTSDELALVEELSEQLAMALESARLFAETQRRAWEQSVLLRISQALAAAPLRAEDVANVIASQLVAELGVPEASVSLLEPEEDILRILADVYADPGEREIHQWQEDEAYHLSDFPATVRVMESLEPLVVQASDPNADPAERAYMEDQGTATLVILPLAVKGQAIGVIELETLADELHYTSGELNLMMTIANQAAVALENARLLSESQARAGEQAVLNEMGQALAACHDVDSVLDEAYRGISRLMDATNFYIMFCDAEAKEAMLAMTAVDGEVEKPRTTQPVEELGLTEYLITTRQPLLIPDRVRERVEELGFPSVPLSPGRFSVSWLGVPMMIRNRVLGTMVVLSYTTPRAYDAHSRDLLSAASNQTAIALENIRLLESTQAALAEVQATHQSYLRRAWQDQLRQRDMLDKSAFVYEHLQTGRPGDAVPAPKLWRPEIEDAVVKGGPVATKGDNGDRERASLAVPITLRGQTLGVLGVEAPDGHRDWTEDEIALIEAVGEQLGQTLETARLFADTQRSAERERLIGEISAKIRASTDVQGILQTAAAELGQVLGTSRALVRVTAGEPGTGRQRQPGETSRSSGDGRHVVDEEQA
ncbi:MAG: GAF domain-containing protein [Anaerolineae bacterium]|jgi:PAS domain S-box-containing protein